MTNTPLQPDQLILGRYAVIAIAGYGGAGPVMHARDTRLQRDVAINTLPRPADFTDNDAYALAAQRLRQHAAVGARLPAHPNLVSIYDFTEGQDGTLYLIREYVNGGTLADRLRTGPVSVTEAVTITSEVAAGLQIAHDCGVVHRDIKPDNIFIGADGHALVGDFGIAQIDDLSQRTHAEYSHPGTPLYMSPEQSRSGYVTPASDQYSLGLVLFEMLTGKRYKPLGKRGVSAPAGADALAARALIARMTAEEPGRPLRGHAGSDSHPPCWHAAHRRTCRAPDHHCSCRNRGVFPGSRRSQFSLGAVCRTGGTGRSRLATRAVPCNTDDYSGSLFDYDAGVRHDSAT